MMIGSQIIRDKLSTGATARLDRQYARRDGNDWLHQVAGKIRLVIMWRIPVGFEDETGFHLGVQPIRENNPLDEERESIFADAEHF